MVRFNENPKVDQLSPEDIVPLTDVSDSDNDKKATVQQIAEYIAPLVPVPTPLPSLAGHDGQYLTNDGTDVEWGDIPPATMLEQSLDLLKAGDRKVQFMCSLETPVTVKFVDGTEQELTSISDLDVSNLSAGTYSVSCDKQGNSFISSIRGETVVTSTGIASNFSKTNYVMNVFNQGENTWEIVAKIKTPTTLSQFKNIMGAIYPWSLAIGIDNTTSKFNLALGSTGTSWDIGTINGTTTISLNTWYYLKATFDGTAYTLSSSLDGETYTTEVTINSTTKFINSELLTIGTYLAGKVWFDGEVDLTQTYFKVGDTTTWNGNNILNESYPNLGTVTLDSNKTITDIKSNYQVTGSTKSVINSKANINLGNVDWDNLSSEARGHLQSVTNYIKTCSVGTNKQPNLLQEVGEGTLSVAKNIKLGTDTLNTNYINTSGFFAVRGDGQSTQNYNETYTLKEPITNVQSVTISLNQWAEHRAGSNIYAYAVFADGETLIGNVAGGGDTNQTQTFTLQASERTLTAIRITAYSSAWSNGYASRGASTTSDFTVNYLQATSSGIELNISPENPLIYVSSDGKIKTIKLSSAIDFSSGYTNGTYYLFIDDNIQIHTTLNYTKSAKAPVSPVEGDVWLYGPTDPIQLRRYTGTAWEDFSDAILIGTVTVKDNAILSLTQPIVGINNILSGIGMPSDKYIDLELGASSSTYIAPANGWFTCHIASSTAYGAIWLARTLNSVEIGPWNSARSSNTIGGTCATTLSVKKDDIIKVNYDGVQSVINFRFYYALGSEPSA